jgi:hypothetical protein
LDYLGEATTIVEIQEILIDPKVSTTTTKVSTRDSATIKVSTTTKDSIIFANAQAFQNLTILDKKKLGAKRATTVAKGGVIPQQEVIAVMLNTPKNSH